MDECFIFQAFLFLPACPITIDSLELPITNSKKGVVFCLINNSLRRCKSLTGFDHSGQYFSLPDHWIFRVGRPKVYPKINEMIGRLRQKYPRVSKPDNIEVIPETGTQKNITIREMLSTHQRLTIEYNTKKENKIVRHQMMNLQQPGARPQKHLQDVWVKN